MPPRAHAVHALPDRRRLLRRRRRGPAHHLLASVARLTDRRERRVRDRGASRRVRTLGPQNRRHGGSEGVTDRPTAALVLVGTPIGNLGDLSPRAVEELRTADVIAAEDTRRTRALLSHAGIPAGRRLRAVHARNEATAAERIVGEIRGGDRVAVVTDAGMPGISDPGAQLVRACLDAGLPVEAVPGPSAALTAVVLSGLPSDRFVFEGFLPRKGRARTERLAALAGEPRTTVLFEAPHPVRAPPPDPAAACRPHRPGPAARELTTAFEALRRGQPRRRPQHPSPAAPR